MEISGCVESSRPEQFARRHISAYPYFDKPSDLQLSARSQTDDRGQFQLTGLLPDQYYLRVITTVNTKSPNSVQRKQVVLLSALVKLTESKRQIVFGGKFPGVVRGTILGLDGDIADRVVKLRLSRPARESGIPIVPTMRMAATDANGQYEFYDVPPGKAGLWFDAEPANGLRGFAAVDVGEGEKIVVVDLTIEHVAKP
jgi:hypothetical protein